MKMINIVVVTGLQLLLTCCYANSPVLVNIAGLCSETDPSLLVSGHVFTQHFTLFNIRLTPERTLQATVSQELALAVLLLWLRI